MIVKEKGRFYVRSKDGKKNLGKPEGYASEAEAKERLRQIEAFKSSDRLYLDEAIRLEKLDDSGKPKWNKLFPLGAKKFREDFPGGSITFDAEMLSSFKRNAKALFAKGARLQANYLHDGGIDPNPSAPLERVIASGWILDVDLRADGLYGLFDWTKRARDFIGNEELCCISPEFALQYMNRDTGKPQGPTLLGAALTNTPFLKELPRVAASDHTTAEPSAKPGARMDRKLLCAALGLSEDASDADIQSKLSAGSEAVAKLSELEKQTSVKLSESATHLAELRKTVKEQAADIKKLSDDLSRRDTDAKEAKAEAFVAKLVDEGRIKPAIREKVKKLALTDFELAKESYGELPSQKGEIGLREGSGEGEAEKGAKAYWGEVQKLTEKGTDISSACMRVNREHPELEKFGRTYLTDKDSPRAR